ncbi:MAG: Zn-ribbon domain-containing OB-fold protein [Trebonia sp.]
MTSDTATTAPEFSPAPPASALTEPFWAGGLSGELRLQKCANCGHVRYPVSDICPVCWSAECDWTVLSGHGTVQSYIVFERAYHEAWADQVPYVVALIQLAEGPVLISNVVGVAPSAVRVGQPVRVTFERRSQAAALPQFTPVNDDGPVARDEGAAQ